MISNIILPSVKEILHFRKKIVPWFKKNGRIYPWRETDDPFKILIAEIMLRRTKADQVKVIYKNFFKEYPDINSIISANNENIMKILYPLGLNWRLPSILIIVKELKGKYSFKVPEKREDLKTLTGVGDYVAGAVMSIAYNEKEWIVDSNIVRLFKRYFGIQTSKEGRRDKHVIEISKKYVSIGNPKQNNLAILDFSALICTSYNPKCYECPVSKTCFYHSNNYIKIQ